MDIEIEKGGNVKVLDIDTSKFMQPCKSIYIGLCAKAGNNMVHEENGYYSGTLFFGTNAVFFYRVKVEITNS